MVYEAIKKQTKNHAWIQRSPVLTSVITTFLDWAEARQGSIPAASPFQSSEHRIVGNTISQKLLSKCVPERRLTVGVSTKDLTIARELCEFAQRG